MHKHTCQYKDCLSEFISKNKKAKYCSIACCNKSKSNVKTPWLGGSKEDFARYQRGRRYGLSLEDLDRLIEAFKICPICCKREAKVIDHDHLTKEVRGYLCIMCNTAIGALNDELETVQRLARYLMKDHTNLLDESWIT